MRTILRSQRTRARTDVASAGPRPRSARRAVVGVTLAALMAIPSLLWASQGFEDVPDTSPFHGDIEWLASADVTRGCNPPANTEFCPDDPVTREQMAAFMNRLANNRVVDAEWLGGMTADEIIAAAATGETGPVHAATADRAATADHATSAESAVTAEHATLADSAVAADHAATADSATFAGHAVTADSALSLDGSTANDLRARWVHIDPDGSVVHQTGGITRVGPTNVAYIYYIDFGEDVSESGLSASIRLREVAPFSGPGFVAVGSCSSPATFCPGEIGSDPQVVQVRTHHYSGVGEPQAFTLVAHP